MKRLVKGGARKEEIDELLDVTNKNFAQISLASLSGDLVADAFADDLAFELRE